MMRRLKRDWLGLLAALLLAVAPGQVLAADRSAPPHNATRESKTMSDEQTIQREMKTAAALTTKVLAIGSWTAKAPPEARPAIMPSEARETMRLELAGKIDQWFAKSDGSGAVFLMNVTTPTEAHALLEALPLGQAGMMTFELIPVGPLWPLGLLLREPAK